MSTQYHLYGNGGTGGPVDYTTALATVSGTSWSTAAALAAGSSWTFAVRAFDAVSGLEESNVDALARLILDGSSADVTNRPTPPALVSAVPIAGGGVRARWAYPIGAGRRPSAPAGFKVYIGTGGASPSYGSPAATVPYSTSRTHFRVDLAGPLTGPVSLAVRAYNGSGEDAGTRVVSTDTADTGPGPVDGFTLSATAVA